MKNRQAMVIIGSILGVLLCCCEALAAWGMYSFAKNPSVKKGIDLAGNEFKVLMELQETIRQTYGCEDVLFEFVNGNTFNISLIDSELNDLPAPKQAEKALEVAKFVKENYTGVAPVTRIVIIFVRSTKVGPVNANNTSSYPFEISELE